MTEAEWLTCREPDTILGHLQVEGSDRKVNLFDVACCRRIHHLLTTPAHDILIQIEQHADQPFPLQVADDLIAAAEREAGHHDAGPTTIEMSVWEAHEAVYIAATGALGGAACMAARATAFAHSSAAGWQPGDGFLDPHPDECAAQCDLLRDIFGNPFRSVSFLPEWRTDTVLALARQMYDSRDFIAMLILADALQDAGCDNDDILNHCRDTSHPHVRGCWVVDLALGKG